MVSYSQSIDKTPPKFILRHTIRAEQRYVSATAPLWPLTRLHWRSLALMSEPIGSALHPLQIFAVSSTAGQPGATWGQRTAANSWNENVYSSAGKARLHADGRRGARSAPAGRRPYPICLCASDGQSERDGGGWGGGSESLLLSIQHSILSGASVLHGE